jgi:hypothetical protein
MSQRKRWHAAVSAGARGGVSASGGRLAGEYVSLVVSFEVPALAGLARVPGYVSISVVGMMGMSLGHYAGNQYTAWTSGLPDDSRLKRLAPYVEKGSLYLGGVLALWFAIAGPELNPAGKAANDTTLARDMTGAMVRAALKQLVLAPYGANIQWSNGRPQVKYIAPTALFYSGIAMGYKFIGTAIDSIGDSTMATAMGKPMLKSLVTGIGEFLDDLFGTYISSYAPGSSYESMRQVDAKLSESSCRYDATWRMVSSTFSEVVNGAATNWNKPVQYVIAGAVGVGQEFRGWVAYTLKPSADNLFHGIYNRKAPVDLNTMAATDPAPSCPRASPEAVHSVDPAVDTGDEYFDAPENFISMSKAS